jgi:hypothetical protein
MRTLSRAVFAGVLFLFGCATGGVASHYVATASAASKSKGDTEWSYLCFQSDDVERIEKNANKAGAVGWELVTAGLSGGSQFSSPIWCFKRSR